VKLKYCDAKSFVDLLPLRVYEVLVGLLDEKLRALGAIVVGNVPAIRLRILHVDSSPG
jgi:hypothetical protein